MRDHIKEYWESQAEKHEVSHWASWGDNWMIDLEIQTIGKYINTGDSVIDIGCANGYSTLKQNEIRKPGRIVGVDFAGRMIDFANRLQLSGSNESAVSFEEGDIRCLKYSDSVFDVAYTTRVLINLPTWEEQKKGIAECLRVVRPGGKVVLSEGFWEPLCRLNALRLFCDLPPLVEHDFNRYLKLDCLQKYLAEIGVSYTIEEFSSIYYLGSRFLRELVTVPENYPEFTNPINEIFYNIEQEYSGGGFGIQQAVIIEKK